MNINAALVLTLVLCTLAAALGYWLGCRSAQAPAPQKRSSVEGPRATSPRARVWSIDSRAAVAVAAPVARASAAQPPATSSDPLRRQINDRLEQLRLARENAQPWAAPAVDRVHTPRHGDLPTRPMVFADTTIDLQALH